MSDSRPSLVEILDFLRSNFGQLKALLSGDGLSLPKPLPQIIKTPLGFIVGVMLVQMFTAVEFVLESILKWIGLVVFGADERIIVDAADLQPQGFWGLADLPLGIAWLLISAGETIGAALLNAVQTVVDLIFDASLSLGPLAPVAMGLAIAVIVIALAWMIRKLIGLSSAIPIVGPLIKEVLP